MNYKSVTISFAALLSLLAPSPVLAIDAETIVKALQPKPKAPLARSFRPAEPKGRGIAIEGGDEKEPPPSIDLYVHFEYDSAALTMSDSILTIDALAKALQDARLANVSFRIIGHTDARGNDDYNMKLSRDRAAAVRQRLIQYHHVDGARLAAEGRGRLELKDPSRPEDGINRRVQIVSNSPTS